MPTPTEPMRASVSLTAPSIGLTSETPWTSSPTYGKVLKSVRSTSSKLLSHSINLSDSLLTIDVKRAGVSTSHKATATTTTTRPSSEPTEMRAIFHPLFIRFFSFCGCSPTIFKLSSAIS